MKPVSPKNGKLSVVGVSFLGRAARAALVVLVVCCVAIPLFAASGKIILYTTTSTQDSGLLDFILPVFEKETGNKVEVHSVGTGAALQAGRDGQADVLLVHDKPNELKFVEDGYGTKRYDVMYNDFIVVGPAKPISKNGNINRTLKNIASKNLPFVSRGDKSGTHSMELRLWKAAGVDPAKLSKRTEAGQGMGATLKMASEMQAYTLTDRATWLKQKGNLDLSVICEGSTPLLNYYGVIPINPAKQKDSVAKKINAEGGQAFADWLLKDSTQKLIASYKVNGEPLFFPNAKANK